MVLTLACGTYTVAADEPSDPAGGIRLDLTEDRDGDLTMTLRTQTAPPLRVPYDGAKR